MEIDFVDGLGQVVQRALQAQEAPRLGECVLLNAGLHRVEMVTRYYPSGPMPTGDRVRVYVTAVASRAKDAWIPEAPPAP